MRFLPTVAPTTILRNAFLALVCVCCVGCGATTPPSFVVVKTSVSTEELNYWQLRLRFGSHGMQENASEEIGALGEDGRAAVADLAMVLETGTSADHAAIALGRIGPEAKAAIPALKRYKQSENPRSVAAANFALWRINKDKQAFADLMEYFDGPNAKPDFRLYALLGYLPTKTEKTIPVLVKALHGPMAGYAAKALIRIGPKVMPHVIPTLKETRSAGMLVVNEFPNHADDAIPAIVELLEGSGHLVAQAAATTLGRIGPKAKSAIPVLQRLRFKHPVTVNFALWRVANDQNALRKLLDFAEKDTHFSPRVLALKTLELADPQTPGLMSALRANIDDPKARFSHVATKVLAKYGRAGLPLLLEALNSKNERIRNHAFYALSEMGTDAKDALPVLMELVKNTDAPDGRVIGVLGKMGRTARPALPHLFTILKKGSPSNKRAVSFTLREIGPDAAPAIPDMLELLKSSRSSDKTNLLHAICCIAPHDPKVVACVRSTLGDKSVTTRITAIRLLGHMQAKAKTALPDLQKLTNDGNTEMAAAAKRAIELIAPPP